MRNAYFEECGLEVAPASDLELRFKAVASEIFSAYSYAQFVLRQGFPQTATGEYLDKHAQLRGIERKTASCAEGELVFSLSEALEADVAIPEGTICASEKRPFVQFATTVAAVITAGETSVTVPARSISGGAQFNAPAGEITVLVNPPEYVAAVTNPAKMTGGFDEENDKSLRERLISSYSGKRFAVNESSIREFILNESNVLDARVYNNGSLSVMVCLKLKSGVSLESMRRTIEYRLGIFSICRIPIELCEAEPFSFILNASIKADKGYDENEIGALAEEMLANAVSSMHIGQNINKTELEAMLYGIEGVLLAEVCVADENAMPFSCPSNSYLVPENITVEVYE